MKRFGLFTLTLSLATLTLVGCDANAAKTPLIHGAQNGSLTTISYEQLSAKVSGEENFIMFSIPKSNCTCWTSFRDSILKPYMSSKHLRVFIVPFMEYYDDDNQKLDTYGLTINSSSQSLGIYKDGQIKVSREYNSTHKIWQSVDSFAKYIDELTIAPSIIDITLASFSALYEQDKNFSVFYYDDSPESIYFRQNVIKPYGLSHLEQKVPLYGVYTEAIGIKLNQNGSYNAIQWEQFKDEYGISSVNNPTWGWGSGFFPTLQYVEPDGVNHNGAIIKAQTTYLNDILTETESSAYQVVDTFYDASRVAALSYLASFSGTKVLTNLIIPITDVTISEATPVWTFAKATVYHNPLVNAFIDYAVSLSQFTLE